MSEYSNAAFPCFDPLEQMHESQNNTCMGTELRRTFFEQGQIKLGYNLAIRFKQLVGFIRIFEVTFSMVGRRIHFDFFIAERVRRSRAATDLVL